jgi:UDP-N-acetylglucosamine--N-acetylmuramyl-(pentapeptide) pyrophosphoryl-undecaprenol N-acetylglucosamine transferase
MSQRTKNGELANLPSRIQSNTQMPFHILIACGGTGGHLFPGIAVAETLSALGHQVTLLISEKKIDSLAASGHDQLHFEKMPFLAMPRPWSPKMIPFLRGLWKGMNDCRALIRKHEIQVVLGMGGFTSLAPLVAGRKEHCKTLIHESNAIPGKANRLNARFCDVVLCGLEACVPHFERNKKLKTIRVVGTPVRSSMTLPPTDDPHEFFKLNKDRKTLLIMGGSQGARGINRAVGASLRELFGMGIQILHITGPNDYQEVKDAYAKHADMPHTVVAFCHRMELAYRVADLAIARSGASTLTELAYFGTPSLLVPYPFAADDHQTRNAEIFDRAGAARLIVEDSLNAETLVDVVGEILGDKKKSAAMKAAAQKLAVRDSAAKIASLVEQLAAK